MFPETTKMSTHRFMTKYILVNCTVDSHVATEVNQVNFKWTTKAEIQVKVPFSGLSWHTDKALCLWILKECAILGITNYNYYYTLTNENG